MLGLIRACSKRICQSRMRCWTCNSRQHSSVCQTSAIVKHAAPSKPQDERPANPSSLSDSSTSLNPRATNSHVQATSTNCCLSDTRETILLQTAKVMWYNPDAPDNSVEISVIFDIKYIWPSEQDQNSNRAVQWFVLVLGKVEVWKRFYYYQCRPYGNPWWLHQNSVVHVICLELGDNGTTLSEPIEPAVLIGLDHYWEFVTGKSIHCDNGSVVTCTILGWIISGPALALEGTPNTINLITHKLKVSTSQRGQTERLE